MEFLIMLLILGVILAVPIWMAVVISRHSSEIRVLSGRLTSLQSQLDRVVNPPEQQGEELTMPVKPVPPPPVPMPREVGVPQYLAGPAKYMPSAAPEQAQPVVVPPARPEPREPGVPEFLAGFGSQSPKSPAQQATSEWWGDFEQAVGKRWMTWVGVLILITAAAFTVKYLYDVGLLGPWVRVALELALGLLILLLGRYALRHRMVALGHGLLGLGLAVFYITLYSAYYFHQLLSAPTELLLIAAVTTAGLLISLHFDALAVAVLSTIGGLLTPLLVSLNADHQPLLLAYILVLDLGVLTLTLFKRWRVLDMLALGGTAIMFAGWFLASSSSTVQPMSALIWLSIFFAVFLLMPFWGSVLSRQPLDFGQLLLILVGAVLYISADWNILMPEHQGLLGLTFLLMALLYLALAVEFRHRLPSDSASHNTLLALAVFCWTLSVPALLSFNVITIVWALEAPLLVLLGYYSGSRLLRMSGFAVLVLDLLRLLIVHVPLHKAGFVLFLNPQFGTAAFIPLAAAGVSLIHSLFQSRSERLESSLKVICGVGAGLLGLLLVTQEISLWFSYSWTGAAEDQGYFSLTTLMLLWVTGSLLFMLAGISWRSFTARALSLALLLIPLVLGIYVYANLPGFGAADQVGYVIFANYRFVAALIFALLVMAIGWLHAQYAAQLPQNERGVPTLLGIAGGLLVPGLFVSEIIYSWSLNGAHAGLLLRAALSWQALVWAIGAALFLLAGIWLNSIACRLWGLLPLLIGLFTAVRAYAEGAGFQVAGDRPELLFVNQRFATALALILVAYAYGLFIRRRRDICADDEQQLATACYVSGNLLLLVLLSREVYGYCESLVLAEFQETQLAHLSLSVLWGAYALAFIVLGFWLSKRVMRLWALGLFGLTALKLLVIDLGYLGPAYRLLSTVVLGLLMIATSYLYHRLEKRLQALPPPSSVGHATE